MGIRISIEVPEPLHRRLRREAESSGASIHSLIVQAIEQAYAEPRKGAPVTGALIRGTGKRGPRFPTDKNPHDFVFS